ncbi:MAG TPA: N-acetylmuramoyl-L-alanine amidase [Candidatus Saccharibacteria bacterium]|nr:N-acetylmuramoyl-L-alanine amidase [Candidatus Saccharibacteria bacterium]
MGKILNNKLYKNVNTNKRLALIITVAFLLAGLLGLYIQDKYSNKVIITTNIINDAGAGEIKSGKNLAGSTGKLSTDKTLLFESKVIDTKSTTANAAYITWDQTNSDTDIHHHQDTRIEARVFNGEKWSLWLDATSNPDERPDDAPEYQRSGFIVGDNMQKIQYRLNISAFNGISPEVDSSSIKIETIDASRGPSLSQETAWQKLKGVLEFDNKALARRSGPPINSRLVWGSPEAYGSPRWEPEYRPLSRVVVHHTAVVPGSDSSAAVRAIWQYHANTLGWGDIGYNYLVDQSGNIFQGRFFDGNYAEANNVDVVGGHTYGNNYGTTGISALGDFTQGHPTSGLIHSIGETAAYKLGAYGLNPAGGETHGGNLLGHRDLGQTACPGENLYSQLSTIRAVSSALFPRYSVPQYAWQYVNQYAYSDEARQNPIDPNKVKLVSGQKLYITLLAKNTGSKTWYPDGDNPVRLGTSNPNDRSSIFCDPDTWLSCGRVGSVTEEVEPGQVATFNYIVEAPDNMTHAELVRREYLNIVVEGVTWMNDPGYYWKFIVNKPYEWQYINQLSYLDPAHTQPIDLNITSIDPGQVVHLVVIAKNTGSKTWYPDGDNPVRLGASSPQDRTSIFCDQSTWLSCGRVSNIAEQVAPGEEGKFEFTIVAPTNISGSPRHFKEYFGILSEGFVWFNDPGMYWNIYVNSID